MGMVARKRYGALEPWVEHPQEYGLASLLGPFKDARVDVVKMLKELLKKRIEYSSHIEDGEEFHSSEQNARLITGKLPSTEPRSILTLG
jgi:Erythromycin esterase